MHNITSEPIQNWEAVTTVKMYTAQPVMKEGGNVSDRPVREARRSFLSKSISHSFDSVSVKEYFSHANRPTELYGMYDMKYNEYTQEFECFLWQRSLFYTMAYFGTCRMCVSVVWI